MQISYDHYRYFYYVAKCKSFTAAAAALMTNQPNVTRIIRNLEGTLGCTLFIRSNHGVTLTPEGEKLYGHIRIAVEHMEAGQEELSLEKTLQSGIVSIGATEVALHCLLLPILKEYRGLYPGVRIHITNHSTPQAIAALKNGLLDFALVTTPTVKSAAITERRIKTVREAAVCSSAYEELLSGTVPLKTLADYPLISLVPQTRSYERCAEFFADHGVPFRPAIEAATTDQILPMVKSDLGVGFVPVEMLEGEPEAHIIALEEKIPVRHICLARRKDHSLSIAARELERLILRRSEAEKA